jgi:hypothetical protein
MAKEHQRIWELGLKIIIFRWNNLCTFDVMILHFYVSKEQPSYRVTYFSLSGPLNILF